MNNDQNLHSHRFNMKKGAAYLICVANRGSTKSETILIPNTDETTPSNYNTNENQIRIEGNSISLRTNTSTYFLKFIFELNLEYLG